MSFGQAVKCIPGDSCPTGQVVSELKREIDETKADVKEERKAREQGDTSLGGRIDKVDDRINDLLKMSLFQLIGIVVSILLTVAGLLAKFVK